VITQTRKTLARNELRRLLENFPKIEIVGEAANATKLIEDLQPDLLFLDIQMPGKNGFELSNSHFGLTVVSLIDGKKLQSSTGHD